MNNPLALPIDTAIRDIINSTNGSNVLNVSTGEEKKYFNPSSEKTLRTVTIDVSRLWLFILVTSPWTPKAEHMALIIIIDIVKIIMVITGPNNSFFFFFFIAVLLKFLLFFLFFY